jgi:hypothetical protein
VIIHSTYVIIQSGQFFTCHLGDLFYDLTSRSNNLSPQKDQKTSGSGKKESSSRFFPSFFLRFYTVLILELNKWGWHPEGYAFKGLPVLQIPNSLDNIERVDASKLSTDEFIDRFEAPGIPVINPSSKRLNKLILPNIFR